MSRKIQTNQKHMNQNNRVVIEKELLGNFVEVTLLHQKQGNLISG